MTVINLVTDIRSVATVIVTIEPIDYISRLRPPRGVIHPAFAWSPTGPLFVYPNGRSSGASKAQAGIPLTFSATYTSENDTSVTAVRYDWNFGDGARGSGPVVTHTYSVANHEARVSVCITDNLGIKRCVGHELLLFADPAIKIAATSGVVLQ